METSRPNLPGLATHYARDGKAFTECGRPVRVVLTTTDAARVNCKRCLAALHRRI